ncbi:uncharacterized protein OE_1044F [Halobacterium salinarum R1]|uniref:Uncharacterized protein n=2 Tax=Halobacterium salinarum NRC-34001 TaxID=2886895 RepID=A0A510N3R1_HALSA|nr:uncharacterized protein OE_1044F [Halobacterium salinarum R1]DAC77353.1 TPA_inf: uncharacterized protein VNG_0027a [Halobacterium salinarum NRC-1]
MACDLLIQEGPQSRWDGDDCTDGFDSSGSIFGGGLFWVCGGKVCWGLLSHWSVVEVGVGCGNRPRETVLDNDWEQAS